ANESAKVWAGRPCATERTRPSRMYTWRPRPQSRAGRTGPPAGRPPRRPAARHRGERSIPRSTQNRRHWADLRKQGPGHGEIPAEFIVPGDGVQIQRESARRIGYVGGMPPPAGEPPDQKTVDGAGGKLACLRARTQFRILVEQPAKLGGRE